MPLVLTSCGVEDCPAIDPAQLDALATWLCEDQCYHDKFPYDSSEAAYKRFEREKRENGGYCTTCRDFAGELLSKFTIRERDSQ